MSQAIVTPSAIVQESHEHSLMRLSFVIFMVAIGLFTASLFLPVFITQAHDIYGYWVLAMGWLGFITFQFAWYATPFALLAIHVSRKSPQLGLFLSIVAIIMASEAFLFTEIPFGKGDKVLDYDLGFYLWYLCFYLVSFSILLRLVAWGSIEDDAQPIEAIKKEELLEVQSTEFSAEQSSVKVKRKIISKQVPIAAYEANTEQYKVAKLPPLLPKKNIYKVSEKEVLKPPPLPTKKWLELKLAKPAKPPTLPTWKKGKTPPPLPVRSLKIAPFFSTH